MTQAEEKTRKIEPLTPAKAKNPRKGVLRGKYNKKTKIPSSQSEKSVEPSPKLNDSNSELSRSIIDDESYSYSPPREQPILQKSKSKQKKNPNESIEIVDKSVFDTFMELNAKTLKWKYDSAVPVEGSTSNEMSFQKNTLVNNNFTVFIIDSHWIQKLRLYMS